MTRRPGRWALGLEESQASTPHMDRLFREGLRLTHCFTVTPVCSPSRASLMTSRYGSELGITDWINRSVEPRLGLDPDLPNWVRLLRDEGGYHTALIGKWHLGTEGRYHPTQLGFQHFMGHREGGWATEDPVLEKNGKNVKLEGLTTDILADEVINYLDRRRESQEPFLLCWHTRAPHTRWLPVADEDWAPFAELDPSLPDPNYPGLDADRAKRMTREYLASVRGVDRNLGRVLDKLAQLGLADDTVVIFTSDHGYSMGHHGIWHKGNGHWLLEVPPPAREKHSTRPTAQSLRRILACPHGHSLAGGHRGRKRARGDGQQPRLVPHPSGNGRDPSSRERVDPRTFHSLSRT